MPGPAAQAAAPAPPVRIAAPDSAEEHEADRIAEAVVRGGGVSAAGDGQPDWRVIHRQCTACTAGGSPCAECEADEAAGTLLLKRTDAAPPAAEGAQAAASAVRGGGHPLPHATRGYFEPRFGTDLSGVRIHTDAAAGAAAAGIGARAFALGRHIAFAPGAFAPQAAEGRRLIAHELAHVVHRLAVRFGEGTSAEMHRAPAGAVDEATASTGGAGGISVTIFTGDPHDPTQESAEAVAKKGGCARERPISPSPSTASRTSRRHWRSSPIGTTSCQQNGLRSGKAEPRRRPRPRTTRS